MSIQKTGGQEGSFEGSPCLAGLGGVWAPATIRRVNADNSFKIEFDEKETVIMPYWYGVTPVEISFDDADKWPAVFDSLRHNESGMTAAVLKRAFHLLDLRIDDAQMAQFWKRSCAELFGIHTTQAGDAALDVERSYQLIRHVGLCANQFEERLDAKRTPQKYFKLYWNQIRMGGREPSEVKRPVTLEDAFLALGLKKDRVDAEMLNLLDAFEQEKGVLLPDVLKRFLSRKGASKAVMDSHPNCPELLPLEDDTWELRRGMSEQGLEGDYAITIMNPHQGNHQWAVAFHENEPDGRVYVVWGSKEDEQWTLTAPTIGIFFWDLAQTGLTWYQDTQHEGGKPVKKTDIGLFLDQ